MFFTIVSEIHENDAFAAYTRMLVSKTYGRSDFSTSYACVPFFGKSTVGRIGDFGGAETLAGRRLWGYKSGP